jgi:hypothetical protein
MPTLETQDMQEIVVRLDPETARTLAEVASKWGYTVEEAASLVLKWRCGAIVDRKHWDLADGFPG